MTKRWFSRDHGFTEKDLLLSGSDHLASAGFLLKNGGPWCLDSAGYLCHLGFELFLKAILLSIIDRFPDDHSLPILVSRINEAGLAFELSPEHSEFLEGLNQYFDLRYPNPESPISITSTDLPHLLGLQDQIVSLMPPQLKIICDSLYEPDEQGKFWKGGRVAMVKENEPLD